MQGSKLSLVKWFRAILSVCGNLLITPAELGQIIGVTRAPTVRSMLARIRAAIESPAADQLLVGLHRLRM